MENFAVEWEKGVTRQIPMQPVAGDLNVVKAGDSGATTKNECLLYVVNNWPTLVSKDPDCKAKETCLPTVVTWIGNDPGWNSDSEADRRENLALEGCWYLYDFMSPVQDVWGKLGHDQG